MNTLQNMSNYIVPAAGTTRGYVVRGVLDPLAPLEVDFRQIALDGQPFRPSGVFVDNTAGTGPLNVTINEIGFSFTVPAGKFVATPYPAPMQHSVQILGEGKAVLVFVDFPVIPQGFESDGGGSGGGAWTTPDVAAILASAAGTRTDVAAMLVAVSAMQTLDSDFYNAIMGAIGDIGATGNASKTIQQNILDALVGVIASTISDISSKVSPIAAILDAVYSTGGDTLAGLEALQKRITGFDTTGNPLPENFDSLPRAYTYSGTNERETESRSDGVATWTKTFAYTAGNLTSESGWVRS